jgi:DNA-directed RNA polymerase subunit RPC12/RpoP
MQPATPDDADPMADPDPGGNGHAEDQTQPLEGVYNCPHCSHPVEAAPRALDPFIICPHCGSQFALPATEDPDTDPEAQEEALSRQQARQEELDILRMHNLSRERRARGRMLSYMLIALLTCIVMMAELIFKAVIITRALHHLSLLVVGYLLFAAAGAIAAFFFLGRARAIARDLKQTSIDPSLPPPDFSTLSDGSQRWKDLEKIK